MENITIGQISAALSCLVGLIGAVVYLKKGLVKSLSKIIDSRLEPIENKINDIDEKTSKNNLENIKTSLINLMELADTNSISIEQKIRAHELYDYYNSHGGNSYVHDKWENLKKEGKI